MQRLLWLAIVVSIGSLFFGGGRGPTSPADFAASVAPAVSFRETAIIWMAGALGLDQVSPEDLTILTFLSVVYCVGIGWTAQFVLKNRSLGTGLDGLLAFLGCVIAIFFYRRMFGQFDRSQITILMLIAVTTSISAILLAALAKAWVLSEVDDHLSGGRSMTRRAKSGQGAAVMDRFNRIARRKF